MNMGNKQMVHKKSSIKFNKSKTKMMMIFFFFCKSQYWKPNVIQISSLHWKKQIQKRDQHKVIVAEEGKNM